MPKRAAELTERQIRQLSRRPGRHPVGGVAGLMLQVKDGGGCSWILRATVGDRRRHIGLGAYPDVTHKLARQRAAEVRDQIWQGVDPIAERKAAQAKLRAAQAVAMTFDDAARSCHAARSAEFRNAKHRKDWISSLERYASPVIGRLSVTEIEPAHVLKVLEPIWTTKTETATRVRQRIEAVMAWAIASGIRQGENPARWANNLQPLLPTASKVRKSAHQPALPWQRVPEFIEALRERDGMGARALEFTILTAARSGEVRGATWDEIDLTAKLWTVPADRMKGGKAHTVPLSPAAVKLLQALPRFEGSPYVFPAARGGKLSDMTLSAVCRRMDGDWTDPATGRVITPHGFRSSFKDWARSATRHPDEVSELALAHINSDATRAAYARDELLAKRTRLMADWSKFCTTAPRSDGKASVTPIHGRAQA